MTTFSVHATGYSGPNRPSTIRLPGATTALGEPAARSQLSPYQVANYEADSPGDVEPTSLEPTYITLDLSEPPKLLRRPLAKHVLGLALGSSLMVAGGINKATDSDGGHVNIAGIDMSAKVARQNYSQGQLGLGGVYTTPNHATILHANVGVNATVDDASNVDLYNEIEQRNIVQIYKHPAPAMERVAAVAGRDFWIKGAEGAGITLGLELLGLGIVAGGRKVYGGDRSANLSQAQKRFNKLVGHGAALAVIGATALTYSGAIQAVTQVDQRTVPAGGQLKGPLQNVLAAFEQGSGDTYVDKLEANAKQAINAIQDQLPQGADWRRFGLVDDLENNDTMGSLAGFIAKYLQTNALVNTGDLATFEDMFAGLYTVDAQVAAAGKEPQYLVPGDHETAKGMHYAAAAGMEVADGKTDTIAGVPVLLLPSQDETTINSGYSGSVARDPARDNVQAAVNEMCATSPAIVMAHDHHYLNQIATAYLQRLATSNPNSVCTTRQLPIMIGGRSYLGPSFNTITNNKTGQSISVLTAGSGGGHRDTSVQFDAQGSANINTLFFNSVSGEAQVLSFTAKLDGSVSASLHLLRAAVDPDVDGQAQGNPQPQPSKLPH